MTAVAVSLRVATPADADLVAEIHLACFEPAWSAADIAAHLAPPLSIGFIAEDGAGPIGFMIAREVAEEAEILSLAVVASARRRGVAAALLGALELAAIRRGARTIYLDVSADNDAAVALYRSCGYRDHGRRAGYYRATDGEGRVDALVLAKSLI